MADVPETIGKETQHKPSVKGVLYEHRRDSVEEQ